MSDEISNEYAAIYTEMGILRKKVRDRHLQSVLSSLAKMKEKSRHVLTLQKALELELSTHKRPDKVDDILELLVIEISPI